MDETIKVVELWAQAERDLLNPGSRNFIHAKRRGAIQAYENVLELLRVHQRHLTTKPSGGNITGCDCHPYYINHGRHSFKCPLFKPGG